MSSYNPHAQAYQKKDWDTSGEDGRHDRRAQGGGPRDAKELRSNAQTFDSCRQKCRGDGYFARCLDTCVAEWLTKTDRSVPNSLTFYHNDNEESYMGGAAGWQL